MASDDDGEERPHRRRHRSRHRSRRRIEPEGNRFVAALVVGIVILLFAAGGWYYLVGSSPAEKAYAEMRALPLIGPVLAANPDAAERMRAAIREEEENPSTGNITRPVVLIGDLRRQYVLPALRSADDAAALAAVAARAALAAHLRKVDPAACRQFASNGLRQPDRLDDEGQRLFRAVLQTLENAYLSGKANAAKAKPLPSRAQIVDMLREAAFQKVDFDRLNAFTSLSDEIACDVELKVDEVPPRLPPDKRGPYARFVLNN